MTVFRAPVLSAVAVCAAFSASAPASSAAPPSPPFAPAARWIWDSADNQPVDAYRLFRRAFSLARRPDRAPLRITADREYRLFVNGAYVGRGPAPNPPAYASFDELDVAAHLRAGENVLAVIVYHLGVPSFPRVLARAGLLAQLDAGTERIVTDASWRWRDAWWEPTGEKFSPFREFTEHLDARREPAGWDRPGFDDADWKPAVALGPVGTSPWTAIEPRDIPRPTHHDVWPESLLFTAATDAAVPDKKAVAAQLAQEPKQPPLPGQTTDLDALCPRPDAPTNATLNATKQGIVVGLDFGREVSGFPEITVESDTDGATLDLGYGEALENGHVSVHRQNNPATDRITLRRGAQTLRIFHHRAFRYMVVALHSGRVRLHAPKVVESGYPVTFRGAFSCSDPRLTQAWEIGRRTMRLCMDQGFMDCPNRERGQYVGDALAEGPVARYAFGDTTLMRRFLRQAKLYQPADGLLEPAYPNDWTVWHGERGPNRIPGYGCLWVVMLEDYWRATGDRALVEELIPTLDRLLAFFAPLRGGDGLLTRAPEWNFIDWARLDPQSALACLNLQYHMALRAASALNKRLQRDDAAGRDAGALDDMFEKTHWDEARGLYRDAPGVYSVHTNALALLTLDIAPDRVARICDNLDAPDLTQVASPYFEGFVFRALCRHDRHDAALKRLRAKWQPQIEAGATTFWEDYAGNWSRCHAWSCEPTALLSRDVLGVVHDAAERTIRFAPRPAGGLTWAQGIVPLPEGDVAARWDMGANGQLTATISCPERLAVILDLPAGEKARVSVDGTVRDAERATGGRHLRLRIPGGAHTLTVSPP